MGIGRHPYEVGQAVPMQTDEDLADMRGQRRTVDEVDRRTHCSSAQLGNLFVLRIGIRKLLDKHIRTPLIIKLHQCRDERVMGLLP